MSRPEPAVRTGHTAARGGAALPGTLVAPGAWGLSVAATMVAGALGQAS